MNTYTTNSGSSSAVPSISDLDGYSLRDYNFPPSGSYQSTDQDEFGFDPPTNRSKQPKTERTYGSPRDEDPLSLNSWPGFDCEEDDREMVQKASSGNNNTKSNMPIQEIGKLISKNLPDTTSSVSRYGQITPPRSNSTPSSSSNGKDTMASTPKISDTERPKRRKAQSKDSDSAPTTTTSPGRKRKNARKSTNTTTPTVIPEQEEDVEHDKRKQSLEKNRVAAAKCRVNKKEKTEQLQRDSHDKAVHNAYLKDQLMRMKEEVQQMNAILLSHANCEGCKSPEEIQKHLNQLGNEFYASHMSMSSHDFNQYPPISMADYNQASSNALMSGSYFDSHTNSNDSTMDNPPLPEFNRSADFEVHTPMLTD